MSETDPKAVRNFARRAILTAAKDVDYLGIGEQFGDEEGWPDEEDAYDAMLAAVDAERRKAVVTVSWPDEQASPNVEKLRHHLTKWVRPDESYGVQLGADMLRGVLAEYDALAGRLAELSGLQAERDAALAEVAQMRHTLDVEVQLIQGAATRIVALETERDDDLYTVAALLTPARGSLGEQLVSLADRFGPRVQELMEDASRLAAVQKRAGEASDVR